MEELIDELRERDFLEPDIRHSGLEVSSAGFCLLSLSPSSFCVLVPSSVLRPLHDDQMGAVYLERLDGQLDLFKLPSRNQVILELYPSGSTLRECQSVGISTKNQSLAIASLQRLAAAVAQILLLHKNAVNASFVEKSVCY